MSGLTCAAVLSRMGHRVVVLEQHYVAGGMPLRFERMGEPDGTFDRIALGDDVTSRLHRLCIQCRPFVHRISNSFNLERDLA